MKIYLSGPMTGLPEFNHPEFNRVTAILRGEDHYVYNPAESWPLDVEFKPREAFANYAQFICLEADAIYLLPGWENSLGVSAELALAKNCGLIVKEWIENV